MPLGEFKVRDYLEFARYFAIAAVLILIARLLPDQDNRKVTAWALGIGVVFDLLSLFYHIMTMVTGKYMSGWPGLGLIFYAYFLVASRFSLVGPSETELGRVLLFKLADLVLLVAFHALCQLLAAMSRQFTVSLNILSRIRGYRGDPAAASCPLL